MRLLTRRAILGVGSIVRDSCLGCSNSYHGLINEGADVLRSGFAVLDPEAGITFSPFTYQLEEAAAVLGPVPDELEETNDAIDLHSDRSMTEGWTPRRPYTLATTRGPKRTTRRRASRTSSMSISRDGSAAAHLGSER